jgi:hypothetical protein
MPGTGMVYSYELEMFIGMDIAFAPFLIGNAIRSQELENLIRDQEDFDKLFVLMFHPNRHLAVRAADLVIKISKRDQTFLQQHKQQLMVLLKSKTEKDLRWHLPLLITKLALTAEESNIAWSVFTYWALNRNESTRVRVNALQGLFDIAVTQGRNFSILLNDIMRRLAKELIPSLQARVRVLSQKVQMKMLNTRH